MSTHIVPFSAKNVPAFATGDDGDLLVVAKSLAGFPVVSIKGKVFTKKDGETSELITKPGDDAPASALEVVILDVGPSVDMRLNSRVFYLKPYEEGSTAKPDCYSDDGVTPGADGAAVQAKSCAVCPHNVKGTSNTGKGKRCSSSKRLAIATPDDLDNPMMLRVPGDSLLAFNEYCKWLVGRGITKMRSVVTKIGFDYSVAHPALTFKGLGFVASDTAEAAKADQVGFITGKKAMPKVPQLADPFADDDEEFQQPAPEAKKPAPAKKKPTPAPVVEDEDDDDLPEEPKATVKVEGEKPAKKSAPVVADVEDADMDDIDLDFDA